METSSIQSRFLLLFLFLASLSAQQWSPCPTVLKFLGDRSILLAVEPPPTPGGKVDLLLRLYTKSKETVRDGEEIMLRENSEALNKRLFSGSNNHILYAVRFTSRVPAVVKEVILNNRIICKNDRFDERISNFEINLVHSFRPDGKPVSSPLHMKLTEVECGRPDVIQPFIHHGVETAPGQWPWHAAIYWQEGAGLQYKCGGTLVTLTNVITAAHCVSDARGEAKDARQLTVYLGKHRLSLWGNEVQIKDVESVYIHPAYNSSLYFNDIAILTFRSPVFTSLFVKPACVWGKEDENLVGIVGKLGNVVGWGQNENGDLEDSLKLGRIQVVSVRECLTSSKRFAHFTTNSTFCAGFRNGTQNPCGGDSGGGLVFKPEGTEEWLLRGVVSIGAPRLVNGMYVCDPNQYTIFTDVTSYQYWITNVIKRRKNDQLVPLSSPSIVFE